GWRGGHADPPGAICSPTSYLYPSSCTLRPRSRQPSDGRTTQNRTLVRTHLSRSADVSATIGRDHVIDLAVGNRRPNTVHFNFVVIATDAALGRPTIHQIAARTSVVSSELRVEALMPFIVALTVVSLLRRSVHTKKQGSRAAECGQQFPPSDGDCHTPLPCEVRKGNDTTPRACCP